MIENLTAFAGRLQNWQVRLDPGRPSEGAYPYDDDRGVVAASRAHEKRDEEIGRRREKTRGERAPLARADLFYAEWAAGNLCADCRDAKIRGELAQCDVRHIHRERRP